MAQKLSYTKPDSVSRVQVESDFTRHCLKQYHDEKIKGYKIGLLGAAIAAGGVVFPAGYHTRETDSGVRYDDRRLNTVISVGGGVVALIGSVLVIDSEKWLKRAYFGPDGIGVIIKF